MDIIVAGAGGAGIKVVQALADSQKPAHDIISFVDDDPEICRQWQEEKEGFFGYPVVSAIGVVIATFVGFVCAIGDPATRERLIGRYRGFCFEYPNIVHPTAQISKYAKIGKGNVFCQNVVIQAGAIVGDFNVFNPGATVGTWSTISDYCTLKTNSVVACRAKLKSYVSLGIGCVIGAYLTIGEHCVVAPNAYVTHDLEDGITVMGNPAKRIK